MEDIITYAVYWKTREFDDWHIFSGWYTTYESAFRSYNDLSTNARCVAKKIVERTEMFENVLENKNDRFCKSFAINR